MSDNTTLPPDEVEYDRVMPIDLNQEMQNSYIDYAMSVIVGRAPLPLHAATSGGRPRVSCPAATVQTEVGQG